MCIVLPWANIRSGRMVFYYEADFIKGVAMDTEPYPVFAGLLIRKAVTW